MDIREEGSCAGSKRAKMRTENGRRSLIKEWGWLSEGRRRRRRMRAELLQLC